MNNYKFRHSYRVDSHDSALVVDNIDCLASADDYTTYDAYVFFLFHILNYLSETTSLSLLPKNLQRKCLKIDEKNNTNFLQNFACGYANPEYEKRKFTRTDLLSATDTIGVKHPFYAIVSCHVLL